VCAGDQGMTEVVHGSDIKPLQPGAPIFEGRDSTFASPIHPGFPQDCWYLSGKCQYWSNNLKE
jgi:hypothetical protein